MTLLSDMEIFAVSCVFVAITIRQTKVILTNDLLLFSADCNLIQFLYEEVKLVIKWNT